MLEKAERDKLVSGFMAYTATVVLDMAIRANLVHYMDDLLCEAYLQLVIAARDYDPNGGSSWKTWAVTRVKWGVYRAMWFWSYGYKKGQKWKTPTVESYDEKADAMDLHTEHSSGDAVAPNQYDMPFFMVDDTELVNVRFDIKLLAGDFTKRELDILTALAFDMTLQELGDEWGMTREGVRQAQSKVKRKVMKRLKNGGYNNDR
jgi:RNA polymerase sigma factor (sigma-70 family)